jgi:hypothetical protein
MEFHVSVEVTLKIYEFVTLYNFVMTSRT